MLIISLIRFKKLSCLELLINLVKYSFVNEKWGIAAWSLFIRDNLFIDVTKVRLCQLLCSSFFNKSLLIVPK